MPDLKPGDPLPAGSKIVSPHPLTNTTGLSAPLIEEHVGRKWYTYTIITPAEPRK